MGEKPEIIDTSKKKAINISNRPQVVEYGPRKEIIDILHRPWKGKQKKPRTYRKRARKEYLSASKSKKMARNNGGDTIDLVDPNGNIVQTVTYSKIREGEMVKP